MNIQTFWMGVGRLILAMAISSETLVQSRVGA